VAWQSEEGLALRCFKVGLKLAKHCKIIAFSGIIAGGTAFFSASEQSLYCCNFAIFPMFLHVFAGLETAKKSNETAKKSDEPANKNWNRRKFRQPAIIIAVSDFER